MFYLKIYRSPKTMATSTVEQINISATANNNPLQHFDQIIALRTIKTIEKLFNSFDRKNMILLIALFGADFIKKELTNVLSSAYQTMKKRVLSFEFRTYLLIIWNKLMFSRTQKTIIDTPVELPLNRSDISFTANAIFYENLYNYIYENTDSNVSFKSTDLQLKQHGKSEYTNTIDIENICIQYNGATIRLINNFKYIESVKNNIKKFKSCELHSTLKPKLSKSTYRDIFDFLPFDNLREDVGAGTTPVNANLKDDGTYIHLCKDITLAIHKKYKLACGTLYSYVIINYLLLTVSKYSESFYTVELIPAVGKVFNFFGIVELTVEQKHIDNCGIRKFNPQTVRDRDALTDMYLSYKINKTDSIIIRQEHTDSNINLRNNWLTFLDQLNTKALNNLDGSGDEIEIFDVKIDVQKTITQKGSPRQITKRMVGDTEEEIVIEAVEEQSDTKTNIEFELVNCTYKDFSTLYLKKRDHHVLSTTLSSFRDKRDIYRDLGLPYKFGALLYGVPGCGKSSAILAIASYLQKDIYYLDFTNIKTNNDLKAVFNKINKEMSSNGIIVMEDIDVMTNIVHDRSLGHYDNSELTLECFLNLLQGSLTADGSVFIATTNNIDILDPAFVRDGRFDVKIHLEECDHFQMNEIYNRFFNRDIPENMRHKLPELTITPAKFISKLLPYILTDATDETIIENILNE